MGRSRSRPTARATPFSMSRLLLPQILPYVTANGYRPGWQHVGNLGASPVGTSRPLSRDPQLRSPRAALLCSSRGGDAVAIQDPDAGPLDATWSVTLSVADGMHCTLSRNYPASLARITAPTRCLTPARSRRVNAALAGMSYPEAARDDGKHHAESGFARSAAAAAPDTRSS